MAYELLQEEPRKEKKSFKRESFTTECLNIFSFLD